MAKKRRKMTPEEHADWLRRGREYREVLEKRKALDEKLRTERERRAAAQ